MGGFAVWTIFWKHKFIALLASHNYAFAAYGLFLAGALAIIGGVFGWCGVWRENRAILLCVSRVIRYLARPVKIYLGKRESHPVFHIISVHVHIDSGIPAGDHSGFHVIRLRHPSGEGTESHTQQYFPEQLWST